MTHISIHADSIIIFEKSSSDRVFLKKDYCLHKCKVCFPRTFPNAHFFSNRLFCYIFVSFCSFVFAEKTTRTATVTTPWLRPWTGINLSWGAQTTTKHPRELRITRPRARLCSSAPMLVYSPSTASLPLRGPARSPFQAAQSRCTFTTLCTTTPYWTLCLLI